MDAAARCSAATWSSTAARWSRPGHRDRRRPRPWPTYAEPLHGRRHRRTSGDRHDDEVEAYAPDRALFFLLKLDHWLFDILSSLYPAAGIVMDPRVFGLKASSTSWLPRLVRTTCRSGSHGGFSAARARWTRRIMPPRVSLSSGRSANPRCSTAALVLPPAAVTSTRGAALPIVNQATEPRGGRHVAASAPARAPPRSAGSALPRVRSLRGPVVIPRRPRSRYLRGSWPRFLYRRRCSGRWGSLSTSPSARSPIDRRAPSSRPRRRAHAEGLT